MEYFEINSNKKKTESVNRTIRMTAKQFNQVMELSERTGVSFNKVIIQCISYALSHMKEK